MKLKYQVLYAFVTADQNGIMGWAAKYNRKFRKIYFEIIKVQNMKIKICNATP